MTRSEYTISKIRVRVVGGETGYVSKIEWTSEGTFQPIEITLDDGRVVNYYDGFYIDEILPDK